MNKNKSETVKKDIIPTVVTDETINPKTQLKSDLKAKEEKDCRDNCMHCGYHCKYLKD